VLSLSDTKFKPGTWDLVRLNTNNFCDELSQFLCGSGVPKYILDVPNNLLETPLGADISLELERINSEHQSLGSSGLIFQSLIGSSSSENLVLRRSSRNHSPELEELEAQIEALRADQLTLEERRNALNLKESKKEEKRKKKEKKEKKERKERKLRKGQSLGDTEEHFNCTVPSSSHILRKSPSLDPTFTGCDTKSDSRPSSLTPSPLHSILKEKSGGGSKDTISENSSTESLSGSTTRSKPLKRVSFDEKPDIIEDSNITSTVEIVTNIKEEQEPQEEVEDSLPHLEEVREPTPTIRRSPTPPIRMAEQEQIEIPAEAEGGDVVMPKKERKPHVKGIVFREFDHVKDFEDLVRTVVQLCDSDEQERLREMEDWIVKNEGTWVLAEGFNTFLGNVLHKSNWPSDARVAMLRLLAFGAEQDDIVLILHMDRKDHLMMNYAQQFDRLPIKEQESLAMLFCNLFETASASEWLLYISEWDAPGGGLPLSNIRVTTKVAVNALLGDTPALVDYGSALMANLATKEVFDDVCSELAMAILQFFQGKPPEEQVFRCMKALGKFCSIASREVPQLVKMIGPEPSKFSGLSPRVDELIEPIQARLATVLGF